MQHQLYNILEKLIVKNNIQVNNEELKLQLFSHPSYPSLHALTGVLNHFNIPNLALRLAVNNEVFEQLPISFIASISAEHVDDLVLIEKKKDAVKVLTDAKKTKLITKEAFLDQWNGIIVAIEKDETVKQTIKNPIIKIAKWILLALGVFLTGYLMFSYNNLFGQAHFLLSCIGLYISVVILKHELGLQSNTINNFCNLHEKTSCDTVLNSRGASVFGLFKLSDISIVVFSCYSLCWFLLFASSNSNFLIVSIVTLLAFPFVIYSLYYQYNVVKKWCPLCLVIALVLMLQIGALFLTNVALKALSFEIQSFVLFFTALITVIGFWSFLKPLLKKNESLEKTEIKYYKFKHNFSLFKTLYTKSKPLVTNNYFSGEIVLGNKEASIEIILVTSPLCFFCKQAHANIESLLHKLEDEIKVIIRFNANTSKKDSELYKIASCLLEIYNTEGVQSCRKALNTLYSKNTNVKKWIQNQTFLFNATHDLIIEEQAHWCKTNAINFTPSFHLNGKAFPEEYEIQDLAYFIDDLLEMQSMKIKADKASIAC